MGYVQLLLLHVYFELKGQPLADNHRLTGDAKKVSRGKTQSDMYSGVDSFQEGVM